MILLTGSKGNLGTELQKHLQAEEFIGDFTKPIKKDKEGKYDLIIHMGAYTDVAKAETDSEECFRNNVWGTFNLVKTYLDIPFVYISTEYANKPLGIYASSKAIAESVVTMHSHYLIIRTLFKPTPWPFETAYIDQYTQGDYVDVIAKLIADKIKK